MTSPAIESAARDWLAPFCDPDHATGRAITTLAAEATTAAAAIRTTGIWAGNLQPGTGWRYAIVVADLTAATAGFHGNLLISLPDFHRCLLLNDQFATFHTPGYVDEKIQLGGNHAAVIATFATMLSERLDIARAPAGP